MKMSDAAYLSMLRERHGGGELEQIIRNYEELGRLDAEIIAKFESISASQAGSINAMKGTIEAQQLHGGKETEHLKERLRLGAERDGLNKQIIAELQRTVTIQGESIESLKAIVAAKDRIIVALEAVNASQAHSLDIHAAFVGDAT